MKVFYHSREFLILSQKSIDLWSTQILLWRSLNECNWVLSILLRRLSIFTAVVWLYSGQEFLLLENGWLLVVWWRVWLLRWRLISDLKWLCRWVHIVHSDLLLLALDLIYSCHWFYLCVIILCGTVISLFNNHSIRTFASTSSVILFRVHAWLPMTSIRTLDLISRLSLFHLPCCGRSILISVLQGILKFNSSIWDRHSLLLNCKCRLSISQDSLGHFWVTWPHCHALWICCLDLHQMVFPLTVSIV